MRVADLMGREPFGERLERTLSAYWGGLYGDQVEVRWRGYCLEGQEWRGNAYLNFFCTRDVEPACFENIVREFSHARVWWRRGLQSVFVQAAIKPPLRELLARVHFCVSQDIPNANQQLVIGGRNRLRIIRPSLGESVVIAKDGCSRLGFDREVAAREGYAKAVSPKFLGARADRIAFSEEYYVGTPANRLSRELAVEARVEALSRLIESVHHPSLRVVRIASYLHQLAVAAEGYSNVAGEQARRLAAFASSLCGSASIGLALTHGDFQNGNILVKGDDLRIIDWETATERSQLYDLATLSADIRLAPDRFDAWRREVAHWLEQPTRVPDLLVAIDGHGSLLGHAVVWLLEEAIFQLEEARAGFQADTAASDSVVAAALERARQYLVTVSR